ncbi:hypothetical protein M422DRAFT_82274, partial [Sphaerobolus stellatus SS14]
YMHYQMNARALKRRIQAKVVSQHFERGRLERVYRHHVMNDFHCPFLTIDHAQTKALLKRGNKSVRALVAKFNSLVELMKDLKKRKKVPPKCRIPPLLQSKKLFRLDVNDDIWNDDGLGNNDASQPPGWLSNETIRKGIVALLQRDRANEELERLK